MLSGQRAGLEKPLRFVVEQRWLIDSETMSGFPFFDIAGLAVVIHVITGMAATFIEMIFNARWTQGMNSINGMGRLFTAPRRDVRFLASWLLILVARAAVIVAAISVVFGLVTRLS